MESTSQNMPRPPRRWIGWLIGGLAILVTITTVALQRHWDITPIAVTEQEMAGHREADRERFKALEDRIARLENDVRWLWKRSPGNSYTPE